MQPLPPGSYRTVDGEYYGTPKEMWGFRTRADHSQKPKERAVEFLQAHHEVFKIPENLRGIRHQKTIESLGAYHVIFQQWYRGRPVHRAYMTVHMDKDGRIYMAKNRVLPKEHLPEVEFKTSRTRAVAGARAALPKKPGPVPKGRKEKPTRPTRLRGVHERWYPHGDTAVPALRVRLERRNPTETWVVYVRADTGRLISKYDDLARAVTGRARVFDPSPVTALGNHHGLIRNEKKQLTNPIEDDRAYRWVTLRGLRGNGRLEGSRVTTSPTAAKYLVTRKHHVYDIKSNQRGFEAVMVYYHIDEAIRYLESLGYSGKKRIFKKPVRADVNGTTDDNSWYEAWNKLLTFGTGHIDDAEDGEIILHELGHAIQAAIVHNWGASNEAAAMGEGFGDYFAGSFFYDKKPRKYQRTMMSWNGLFDGLLNWRDAGEDPSYLPPAQRFLDDPWKYRKHFDHADSADPHDNGEIWAVTLWDIFLKLGRDVADRIIIDSHFQLDPYTTFARGARAILDADTNLFKGKHHRKLKNVFKYRQIDWEA